MNGPPAVRLRSATLRFGARTLWSDLDIDVIPGEMLAVLGPNGSGKTSLLRVLLGLQRLTGGTVEVLGRAPRAARLDMAYIPQQRLFHRSTPLRGWDLVRFGVDGHRWGIGRPWSEASRETRARVDAALEAVGAHDVAAQRLGRLSGGEQQRLRVAQALASSARLLLCDEPLLSLDLRRQQEIVRLINRRREESVAVILVTHEINPVLHHVSRVLYIVNGRFCAGTIDEVMNATTLSQLYGTDVDVVRVRGRLVVVTGDDALQCDHHELTGTGATL